MSIVMPKGDGTLKAINASVKIYYNNRNKEWLINDKFKKLITEEMGFEFLKNSEPARDGPFLLKKSEVARYFGLIDYVWSKRKGKITDTGIKYYESSDVSEKINIIIKSLNKISFNQGNSGVKGCNSIIEPPKLFLKSIHNLKYITKIEFGLLLYRIADQQKTFQNSINEILSLRAQKKNCPQLPNRVINKYYDIKFAVFFENLNIIKKIEKNYFLSDYIVAVHLKKITQLSIYNQSKSIKKDQISGEKSLYNNLTYPVVEKPILDNLNNRIPERPKGATKGRYTTNPKIAETVLSMSHHECYFDKNHKTFVKKNGDIYMEGHHFIPMNAQDDFLPKNLDRDVNIVCLCPTCHKKLHKAQKQDKIEMLKKLYDEKIYHLKKEDIFISFEDLVDNYYT
tara:strand:+ start:71 stop:1261 length:1191 start_codon:yes stop_codon:yes gene_type:complete